MVRLEKIGDMESTRRAVYVEAQRVVVMRPVERSGTGGELIRGLH
jgi:hypothetical protein